MTPPRILIAGGGIGGLTTAIALLARGFEVEAFEAAPVLEAVGAGIALPPNALQVLDRLDVADAVCDAGVAIERAEVVDVDGGLLQVLDGATSEARWGWKTVALLRSELQRILAERLPPGVLRLGKRLERFADDGDGVRVRFADGSDAAGDLLVGADGLRSAVRSGLLGEHRLRYSGQSCYRGLAPTSRVEPGRMQELWGGASRFGYAGVAPDLVYWFAPYDAPAGVRRSSDEAFSFLSGRYAGFPDPVPALLAATAPESIFQTDLYDLAPLRAWHRGRVVLVGDAAHATTPNLGQGGAQAIEDALSLALHLEAGGVGPRALAAFEGARIAKTRKIVTGSRRFGKLAHLEDRFLRRLRNMLLRATPRRVMDHELDAMFTPAL